MNFNYKVCYKICEGFNILVTAIAGGLAVYNIISAKDSSVEDQKVLGIVACFIDLACDGIITCFRRESTSCQTTTSLVTTAGGVVLILVGVAGVVDPVTSSILGLTAVIVSNFAVYTPSCGAEAVSARSLAEAVYGRCYGDKKKEDMGRVRHKLEIMHKNKTEQGVLNIKSKKETNTNDSSYTKSEELNMDSNKNLNSVVNDDVNNEFKQDLNMNNNSNS